MKKSMLGKIAVLALAIGLFAGGYAAEEAESPSQGLLSYLKGGNGDPNVVLRFMEQGADVNAIGTFGDAPIHSAIARGYIEIVKLLISKGAAFTGIFTRPRAGRRSQSLRHTLMPSLGFLWIHINIVRRTWDADEY
jgi:hypothetical protein